MEKKKCAIICNMNSGRGIKRQEIDKVMDVIERHHYRISLHITQREGHAKQIMEELENVDLVLSLGGDGTFNEVVTGNCRRKDRLLLAHLPVGTMNDIGNMFGLNKGLTKNVENILNGEKKQVDIGLINTHPFVYVAGFGKFIDISYATDKKSKRIFGTIAYIFNGIKEFFKRTRLYEIEYKVDNNVYKGLYSLVLISNANRVAGFNNIYKDVKLDDDRFEIVFCNITKRSILVKSVLIAMRDGVTNVPGIYFHRAKEVTIKFSKTPRKHWTIDGEEYGEETEEYHISIDKKIFMLLPKKNIKKLFNK